MRFLLDTPTMGGQKGPGDRRGPVLGVLFLGVALCLPLSSCRRSERGEAERKPALPPSPEASAGESPSVEIRGVDLHVTDPIALEIRHLRGKLVTNRKGIPPVFDDKTSFTLRIDAAEIAMTSGSLSNLFNTHVFAYPGAPLRDVHVRIEGQQLVQTGKLAKAAGIPFEIRGELSLRSDGKIQLHPVSIKAAGIAVQGLMKFLGVDLARVIKLHEARGVSVAGNDLLLDPEKLLPPPAIEGRVTAVRLENDRVVEVFGAGKSVAEREERSAENFMRFRGGHLRFGKLTMHETDMTILDQDPKDPFEMFLDHYNEQLVAGYSKNTPAFGLRVYMPDFDDMRRAESSAPAPAK